MKLQPQRMLAALPAVVLPCAMFLGGNLLTQPMYSGGPMNTGGAFAMYAGLCLLCAAHLASSFFFPITLDTRLRHWTHLACWWFLLTGMLYTYSKFPCDTYVARPGNLEMWFHAGAAQFYIVLCFASLSFYMGMARSQQRQWPQALCAVTAHVAVFYGLTWLVRRYYYLLFKAANDVYVSENPLNIVLQYLPTQ